MISRESRTHERFPERLLFCASMVLLIILCLALLRTNSDQQLTPAPASAADRTKSLVCCSSNH